MFRHKPSWLNIVLFFIAGILLLNIVSLSRAVSSSQSKTASSTSVEPKSVDEPAVPLFIMIPSINLKAKIEPVGLVQDAKMANPLNKQNAAWFNHGSKPGEKGTAVISGHYDTTTGAPSVFYHLSELNPGDEIDLFDNEGHKYAYLVDRKQVYANDAFPIDEVFGQTGDDDKARLNLITCEGTYDRAAQNYTHRTVVYARLIE